MSGPQPNRSVAYETVSKGNRNTIGAQWKDITGIRRFVPMAVRSSWLFNLPISGIEFHRS
jgi:hypothetical protein